MVPKPYQDLGGSTLQWTEELCDFGEISEPFRDNFEEIWIYKTWLQKMMQYWFDNTEKYVDKSNTWASTILTNENVNTDSLGTHVLDKNDIRWVRGKIRIWKG